MEYITVLHEGLYWLIFSVLLALFEIEIEGKHGWAEELPTWKLEIDFPGINHSLTGYHLMLSGFLLTIFHLPYLYGLKFTLSNELLLFARLFSIAVIWDFLWFVLNPHYGIKNFDKNSISWHADSQWFIFPAEYYILSFISVSAALASGLLADNMALYRDFIASTLVIVIGVLFIILIAPLYHRWRREINY